MSKTLNSFVRDESGATAIEYGLIAALVSVALDLSSKSGEGTTVTLFFPHDTTDAAERLRPLMDSLMDSAPSSEDLRRK